MPDHHHVHQIATDGAASAGFFANLFESFVPRRQCMNYEADVVWLHVFSDLFIALAYYSIPLALVYFVRRRRDLQFNWMFLMFAAFILACGTTHLFGVWAIWNPMYRLDGLVKAGTAAVSVATAILLWPLIPKALALPSPAQLASANAELEREIAQRKTAQEELRASNENLEHRVQERTQELDQKNQALQKEIQERIRAEEERNQLLASERRARSDAQRANRLKDEFLATLSHELRTPLNAIMGWAQLLGRPRLDEDTLRQGLETIERSVRVQTKLVEDLLDMSRITAGKMRLFIQPVDLRAVVDAAVEVVLPAAQARGVEVLKSLPASAPMMGDADRLQQVAWNLLSNAIKFTPGGGRVYVELSRVDDRYRLSVRDTGQGIKSEFLPFVFERFRQADSSSTRRHGGLGLGLSIVRHLVDLHGGMVDVSSEGEDRGATFTVELPARMDIAAVAPPVHDMGPSNIEFPHGMAPGDLTGARVLVVEDDPAARDLLRRTLVACHAEVAAASSAVEGLELHRVFKPNLMVCDIGMPDRDGYDFIAAVRALPPDEGGAVPAVALSALAQVDDRIRALSSGFHRHLAKPVEPFVLVALLGTLLNNSRGSNEKSS